MKCIPYKDIFTNWFNSNFHKVLKYHRQFGSCDEDIIHEPPGGDVALLEN